MYFFIILFRAPNGSPYRARIGAVPRSKAPLEELKHAPGSQKGAPIGARKGAPTGALKHAPGSQKGALIGALKGAPTGSLNRGTFLCPGRGTFALVFWGPRSFRFDLEMNINIYCMHYIIRA